MLVLISYDVNTKDAAGRKRLRQIAKACTDYGQRVQNSVFECWLNNAEAELVKHTLLGIMNPAEDSLRIYNLGNNFESRIEHYGTKQSYDPTGFLEI